MVKGFLANPLSAQPTSTGTVCDPTCKCACRLLLSDDEIRTLVLFFESHVQPAAAFYSAEAYASDHCGKGNGAAIIYQHVRSMFEVCHATGDPAHDKTAIAPNFLFVQDRLQPAWTERWITNPALIAPDAMLRDCSKRDGDKWVFLRTAPPELQGIYGRSGGLAGYDTCSN